MADINEIHEHYTNSSIRYMDDQLDELVELAMDCYKTLRDTIPAQVKALEASESLWEGAAKEQYLGLKDFINQYNEDLKDAFASLHTSLETLQSLIGQVPSSQVLKEIDQL